MSFIECPSMWAYLMCLPYLTWVWGLGRIPQRWCSFLIVSYQGNTGNQHAYHWSLNQEDPIVLNHISSFTNKFVYVFMNMIVVYVSSSVNPFHIFCSFAFGDPIIFWLVHRYFCFLPEICPLSVLKIADIFHLSVYLWSFSLVRHLIFLCNHILLFYFWYRILKF